MPTQMQFRWNEPKRTVFAVVDLQENGKLLYGAAICHHEGHSPSRVDLSDHWNTAKDRLKTIPVMLEVDNHLKDKENTKVLRTFVRQAIIRHGVAQHLVRVDWKLPNKQRRTDHLKKQVVESFQEVVDSFNSNMPQAEQIRVHHSGTFVAPVIRVYSPKMDIEQIYSLLKLTSEEYL